MKQPFGIFDLFDELVASELGVSVETYNHTIDEFNDEDMKFIIETILDQTATPEDRQNAKDLFNTKVK